LGGGPFDYWEDGFLEGKWLHSLEGSNVMDSSGKNFFLGVEVFELFCDRCLWFGSKVIWMLWIVWIPPAEVVVVDWNFSFPVGIESTIVVLSEFYPEIVVSFCDEFYREFPVSWFIDVIACM